MSPWFLALYLIFGGGLIAVELVGVIRPESGDTLTDLYRALAERFPLLAPAALVVSLVWLVQHLLRAG